LTLRVERKRNLVEEKDIYRQFIDWLNQTWWGLPPAGELLPLILQRRKKTQDPPIDPRNYMQRFFAERKSRKSVS
jgi:hypothetical protein